MYICIYIIYIYIYIYIYICMYVCMYVCMYTCLCTQQLRHRPLRHTHVRRPSIDTHTNQRLISLRQRLLFSLLSYRCRYLLLISLGQMYDRYNAYCTETNGTSNNSNSNNTTSKSNNSINTSKQTVIVIIIVVIIRLVIVIMVSI